MPAAEIPCTGSRLLGQELEVLGFLPTINPKVGIERQDFPGIQFFGKADQTGIGKIDLMIAIFPENTSDRRSRAMDREWYLKNAFLDIFQNRF